MPFPNRATVKLLELTRARGHIGKPTQPDEAIRIIQVAKLSYHNHAGRFLTFDEVPFEKRNKHFASAGHETVLPKFDYWAAGAVAHRILVKSIVQLVSQVLPRSSENACSQCGVVDRFIQRYRTRIGWPRNMSSA